MEENTNEQTQDNTEVTPEVSSAETQSTESQSVEARDTEQSETSVNSSLGIEKPEADSETSDEVSQPTLDEIVAEVMSGEVSEETQKLIEDNNLGKHLDMLVEGHKAIQEKNHQEIFSAVGGEEAYKEIQEWGANNLSDEEQEAFNEGLFSGNMHLAKLAVQGLKAAYEAVNGRSPARIIEGGGSANALNSPFTSQMDYVREATSFKYKSDPEYRASIEARRSKSGF